MKRAPDWIKEEFETLITHWHLSDADLSVLIPTRTVGAIQAVRSGIHEFHLKGASSLLSKMMQSYIEQSQGLKCPLCGASLVN